MQAYAKRLLLARMRILLRHGFYGLLLMHMKFSLDTGLKTAATDGTRILFSPEFMDQLDDAELEFVMMHEILHVVLEHCFRQGDRENERFNIACDIVVNSNILKSNKMDIQSITQKNTASPCTSRRTERKGTSIPQNRCMRCCWASERSGGRCSAADLAQQTGRTSACQADADCSMHSRYDVPVLL